MKQSWQQADRSRQTGPEMVATAIAGALCVCLFLMPVGCSERVSPAAPKAMAMTSTTEVAASTNDDVPKANEAPAETMASQPKSEPQASPASERGAMEAKSEPAAKPEPKTEPQSLPTEAKKPTRDISFDTIKFDMKKEDPFDQKMLTPTVKKLVSNKVRIRGYILPSFQQEGLKQFVLVRDNLECCFGPGAALYDCVVVQMNEGKSTDFTTRPVAVEGVFSLDELRDADGKCLAIYHLQGDKVQ